MIFAFEGIDASLDLLPLAARRALDAAGRKISLDAWRKLSMAARRELVARGTAERVDPAAVRACLRRAGARPTSIPAARDPNGARAPALVRDGLGHDVAPSTWRALSPLERYALVKLAAKPRGDRLQRAFNEIVLVPEPREPAAALSTHLTEKGEVHMVDVGGKVATLRRAAARARVSMATQTVKRLRAGDTAKGDVLATARIAGIQAAKRTPELIPLCHVVALTGVTLDADIDDGGVNLTATAEAFDRTGVEMEAMVAASVAALTVYDMLKGVDRGMRLEVELEEKSGGRTGTWRRLS